MKKLLYIVSLVLAATCVYAQGNAPRATESATCDGYLPGYPDYYCECKNASTPFTYPLDIELQDTMWFSTTIDDLKQGLSAYWFSDCSVTFEVYAFCSSKQQSIKMTVGANQMREMDVAEINRKLDAMGDWAAMMSQTLKPRVKVYSNGCAGHVYCYPYDQGPVSTCADALPVIPRMTYVCDQAATVYELKPGKIASNGIGFIRWKQKNNLSSTIRLTADSCNGREIARAVLADSMRVMLLDADSMMAMKTAGRSVFVHVSHPDNYVGRMTYHNRIVWEEQSTDTTLCQGKKLQLADTALSATTVYPNDTLWKRGDTLNLMTYHLTIEQPIPQYDTLLLKAAQLPMTYRNQYIPKDGWGDYDFTIRQANRCDEQYLVHVAHKIETRATIVDTTVCQGISLKFSNVTYTTDTVIRDSAWADADTWVVSDISIHFTEPELEYDTVSVAPSQMQLGSYWYDGLGVVLYGYGDTVVVKTKKNTCTRRIQITVLEGEEIDTTDIDRLPASPACTFKYIRDGILYIRREGKDYDLLGNLIK